MVRGVVQRFLNWAYLPKTQGRTIRVLWVILAPKYDFSSQSEEETSKVAESLIFGAVQLARTSPSEAQNVKIHCGNVVDRQYFVGVASTLRALQTFKESEVKGNWLHITI